MGPYEHSLTQQLVQKYCFAIDSTYPWQITEGATIIPIIPPTMLGNLSFRLLETKFYRQPGTIHASQEMAFFSPIRLEDKLLSRGKILDKYIKRDKAWIVYEVHFYDENGRELGYSRLTEVLPRAERKTGEMEKKEKGEKGILSSSVPPFPLSSLLGPISRKVTQEKMTAYSEDGQTAKRGVSIHISEEVARKAGFKGTLAQGLMSADYISELMAHTFGPGWIQGGKLSLKFIAPVYAGDEVTAKGINKEYVPEGEDQRALVEVWCENQTGQKVTIGTASALVRK